MRKLSRPAWPAAAALMLSTLLAACGVGIGIELGPDDDPPSVSLSIDPTRGPVGTALRLSAAASDDDYVWEVNFYRIESDGRSTLLCNDRAPNWDCNTQIAAGLAVGTVVNYFARAVDSGGHTTDSTVVGVTVTAAPG